MFSTKFKMFDIQKISLTKSIVDVNSLTFLVYENSGLFKEIPERKYFFNFFVGWLRQQFFFCPIHLHADFKGNLVDVHGFSSLHLWNCFS